MTTAKPSAPERLGTAGKDLWRRTQGDLPPRYEYTESELTVLDLACRQADDLDRLERAIRRDGVMSKGSTGQPVLHPAIGEARQARATIARLLGRLEVPATSAAKPTGLKEVRGAAAG